MKLRNGYLLRQIAGQAYLLPYGQNIMDQKRGICLNESGLLLIKALKDGSSKEALLDLLAGHYQAAKDDMPRLSEDLQNFLAQLTNLGILEPEISKPDPQRYFSIGPLKLGYQGPDSLLYPALEQFSEDLGTPDQTIPPDQTIIIETGLCGSRKNGTILVRSDDVTICDCGQEYLLLYPKETRILECHLGKDGSLVRFCCVPPLDFELAETLFHAMRFAFLVLAQRKGLFVIHSASILYQGKAWLFAGRSGAGKTTHTTLWKQHFGTPVLNGDLNLVGMKNDLPYVYGIPWCGTSGLCTTECLPLGGIILLKQNNTDELIPLSEDEKQLLVAQRFISPSWNESLFSSCLDFAEAITAKSPVFRLLCTKEASAVHRIKAEIDKTLT